MPRRDEQNHNPYFNSEDLLMEGFFKGMEAQGVDLADDGAPSPKQTGGEQPFFVTQRPNRKSDESKMIRTIGKKASAGSSGEDATDTSTGYMSLKFLEDLAEILEETKSASVTTFEKHADNSAVSADVERIIRLLERVQEHAGVEYEKFQPLKHKSGLKSRDKFENTNLVVANTAKNYQSFPLVDIRTAENGTRPAVLLTIIGQSEGIGFIATGLVSAKTDFTGAEAVDYVHETGEGGIMAVKTYRNGRWVDVSEDFTIKLRYEEYDLEKRAGFEYTMFLGENIVGKKDFLLKQAKLEEGTVEFGTTQVFSSESCALDKIRETIGVKPE